MSITGTLGEQYSDVLSKSRSQGITVYQDTHGTTSPWTVGATATQTVFNGMDFGVLSVDVAYTNVG